jgi:preprotein translocase subunit YajC
MNDLWILAQAQNDQAPEVVTSTPVTEEGETVSTVADSNGTAAQPQQPRGLFGGYSHFLLLGLMLVMFYLILFRGPRKKQQQHTKMVQLLQKNDRVRTIGGIIATVVDVREDEITLKVDESNNTKIKVAPSAIGKNLSKQ